MEGNMQKTEPRSYFSKTVRDALPVADLKCHVDGWLITGEINPHSSRTLDTRRDLTGKLLWFLTTSSDRHPVYAPV
jgi:hypothetical protein